MCHGPRLANPLPIKMDGKTDTSIPFRKVIDSLVRYRLKALIRNKTDDARGPAMNSVYARVR